MPRLFSSSLIDISTPRRRASSGLMNRQMTFLPLNVPASASGAFQVEMKLGPPAEADAAAAARATVAHRERIDGVISSPCRSRDSCGSVLAGSRHPRLGGGVAAHAAVD